MFASVILFIFWSCWTTAYAFVVSSPFALRNLKISASDVIDADWKTFQYVPTGNRAKSFQFIVSTFDKLVGKVRTLADFELFAGDMILDSEHAFAKLPRDVHHHLRIESLSHEFSYYTKLVRCRDYLQIDRIAMAALKSFPDCRDLPNFTAERDKVAAQATLSCLYLAEGNRQEAKLRDFITMIVKAAAALVDPIANNAAEGESEVPMLKIDFKRTYTGRRANGKLDFLFMFLHLVIPILEVKDLCVERLESAVLQLGAQFRAIFDQTLREYCRKYQHLTESEIKEMMEQYPNYGMVSTADKWALVRYTKAGMQWKLEMSTVLPMTVFLGMRPNKAQLVEQIGNILGPLVGIITTGMRDAVALEAQLERENLAAKAGGSGFDT